jgi:hypothetical protein
MRVGVLVLAITLVTACSSDPYKATSAKADDEGLICAKSVPTGSALPEVRCTTAQERAADRRQQRVLMDVRNERDSGIR